MAHYKYYLGDDKREDRYKLDIAILIHREEPEEELDLNDEEDDEEEETNSHSSSSLSSYEDTEHNEDMAFVGDLIGSTLSFLFRTL